MSCCEFIHSFVCLAEAIWIVDGFLLYKSSMQKKIQYILVKMGWGHWNHLPIFHGAFLVTHPWESGSFSGLTGSKSVPSSRRKRFNLAFGCGKQLRLREVGQKAPQTCESMVFFSNPCTSWLGFNFKVLFFPGWLIQTKLASLKKKLTERKTETEREIGWIAYAFF